MSNKNGLFIIGERLISRTEFDNLLAKYKSLFEKHRRIIIHSDDPLEQNLALILCRDLDRQLFLCHSFFDRHQVQNLSEKYKIDLILKKGWAKKNENSILESNTSTENSEGAIFVFTSGTTGKAKIAQHKWSSIEHSSSYIKDHLSQSVWMMMYSSTSYAGLQVFFSAYNNCGNIYYPPPDYKQMAHGMVQNNVDVVSGTPTFWRMLINSWPYDLPHEKLKQVTIGGEIVDQDILDTIKAFFRPEKITHIYASTEAGTAIIVSDGFSGFPQNNLNKNGDIKLRVVDDILQVQTPASMTKYIEGKSLITDDGWIITGDVVELRGNRLYFKGRQDGMINVGGQKVLPEEVETALRGLDEITDCRVYSKKNPILSSIVVADIILGEDIDLDPQILKKKLREVLSDFKIPRLFIPVSKIEVSSHGKKSR